MDGATALVYPMISIIYTSLVIVTLMINNLGIMNVAKKYRDSRHNDDIWCQRRREEKD